MYSAHLFVTSQPKKNHIPLFGPIMSKEKNYQELVANIKAIIEGETDLIAIMSNIAAEIHQTMKFWWTGFYRVKDGELILGSYGDNYDIKSDASNNTIGFWGDNYSDQERTRWIMKLFRHYVFEGKTSLLSEQYGMKLIPGHLCNASFRQGTEYWKTSGKIELGTMSDGGAFLKRFNNQQDSSRVLYFEHTQDPAGISQMMKNLIPGKLYKIRMVVTGSGMVAVRISGRKYPVQVFHPEKKDPAAKISPVYAEVTFKAEKTSEMLELNNSEIPPETCLGLHYVSVLSYFGETDPEKSE